MQIFLLGNEEPGKVFPVSFYCSKGSAYGTFYDLVKINDSFGIVDGIELHFPYSGIRREFVRSPV